MKLKEVKSSKRGAARRYGCNASQWAALAGSVETCEFLQKQGAHFDLKKSRFRLEKS